MSGAPATTFEPVAPPGGALAAFHLAAADEPTCEALLRRLRLAPLPTGTVALRDLGAIDTAVVARPTATAIILTPHAGPVVTMKIERWLTRAGARPKPADPRTRYPEARALIEACMLDALASAASPLAIDALLLQPSRWRGSPEARSSGSGQGPRPDAEHDRILDRLLTPPLLVVVGHANIGKSTLVNALARRTVALASDLPGTTRDHVGVTLDLAGLVVRWIDTPGVRRTSAVTGTDKIEREALALARDLVGRADLILSCADATAPFLDPATLPIRDRVPVLTCATRADLKGGPPPAEVITAAARERGLDILARTIRDRLVPPGVLSSPVPWRFHPALRDSAGAP